MKSIIAVIAMLAVFATPVLAQDEHNHAHDKTQTQAQTSLKRVQNNAQSTENIKQLLEQNYDHVFYELEKAACLAQQKNNPCVFQT